MAFDFSKRRLIAHKVKPIKQSTSETCWAATLAWWLNVLEGKDAWTEEKIYWKYSQSTTGSTGGAVGTNYIPPAAFERILKRDFHAATTWFSQNTMTTADLERILALGVAIMGWDHYNGRSGHINGVLAPTLFHSSAAHKPQGAFLVMEPSIGAYRFEFLEDKAIFGKVLIACKHSSHTG